MISKDELVGLVREKLEAEEILIEDLTGAQDHYRIEIRSEAFHGLKLIDQHRLVQSAVQVAYDDGRLHALSIKTIPVESA